MWKFSDCYVNEFLCVSREASEVNLTITMPDCKCRPHIVIGIPPVGLLEYPRWII